MPGPGASLIQNNMAIKFTTDAPSGFLSNSKLEEVPISFNLMSAYPNPFNSKVTIPFELNKTDMIGIKIYDIKGRIIETFNQKIYNIGLNSIDWDAENIPSGLYFVELINSDDYKLHTKIALIK